MSTIQTKFLSNGYMVPVNLIFPGDDRVYFSFQYDKGLIEQIKNLEGRRWHGYDKESPKKLWSAPLSERNQFTIRYLEGKNPYAPYEKELIRAEPNRKLFIKQKLLFQVGITRKQCIFASEPGTGKSLAAIEVLEYAIGHKLIDPTKILWGGTKGSNISVELELEKWNALCVPRLWSYNRIVKAHKDSEFLNWLPQAAILDESSKLKNGTAQRTEACAYLAELMRKEYGDQCYIIEMSGSCSPKSPVDWFSQSEIACPGYLSEPNVGALQRTLALVEQEESLQGGVFPKLKTWLDDENKCGYSWTKDLGYKDDDGKDVIKKKVCGEFKENPIHTDPLEPDCHAWIKSVNQVQRLHKRLSGLVEIVLKKDCVDLPEVREVFVDLKPSDSILRTARLVIDKFPRVVTAMCVLRELSDGFIYEEEATGETTTCPECQGSLTITTFREQGGYLSEVPETIPCGNCVAGRTEVFGRKALETDTPKEEQLILDLEDHEDIGRLVVGAAFQGSIDRVTKICRKNNWGVIQVDGRGWKLFSPTEQIQAKPVDMLRLFQANKSNPICFVGHPGSAGMGLTLTASPTLIFWSLPFDGEQYIQFKERIHRPGMSIVRGATIKYYFNLPTDRMVYENLKNKVRLQSITMGQYISKSDIEKVLR